MLSVAATGCARTFVDIERIRLALDLPSRGFHVLTPVALLDLDELGRSRWVSGQAELAPKKQFSLTQNFHTTNDLGTDLSQTHSTPCTA